MYAMYVTCIMYVMLPNVRNVYGLMYVMCGMYAIYVTCIMYVMIK